MKNLEYVNKLTTGQNRQGCEMAYLLDLSVNEFSMASVFHAGDRGSNPLGDAKLYEGSTYSMLTPLLTHFLAIFLLLWSCNINIMLYN